MMELKENGGVNHNLRSQIDVELAKTENPKKILVLYRALFGDRDKETETFAGLDDKQLRDDGIFLNNTSFAQQPPNHFGLAGLGMVTTERHDRKVSGLPVFATLGNAVDLIAKKTYRTPPAIAVLLLPFDVVFGQQRQVNLIRNHDDPWVRPDIAITEAMIEAHSQGQYSPFEGELYLQGKDSQVVPRDIREYESLYRPRLLPNGRIDISAGFEKVSLEQ